MSGKAYPGRCMPALSSNRTVEEKTVARMAASYISRLRSPAWRPPTIREQGSLLQIEGVVEDDVFAALRAGGDDMDR
jgi:hypothetical protein